MRFSSADSLSRPTADIRTSIAPSSNIAIIFLRLSRSGRTRQNHLGAAKESFQLAALIRLQRSRVLERQLPEPVTQAMESYPRCSICDAEVFGHLAERDVTAEADQHHLLFPCQLA